MIPKIDYKLLGEAVHYYTHNLDYTYVEVPWLVPDYAITATLPEGFDFLKVGTECRHGGDYGSRSDLLETYYDGESALVGSAEQGFITMHLPPGRYVGVTPCFRTEQEHDLFHQDTFMKVELFDNRADATAQDTLKDAMLFFRSKTSGGLREVETSDGFDIYRGGIEIGSYGVREHPDFGRWVYGTGLALPRFSVADALSRVCQ